MATVHIANVYIIVGLSIKPRMIDQFRNAKFNVSVSYSGNSDQIYTHRPFCTLFSSAPACACAIPIVISLQRIPA
eukprot:4062860-Heterocapsa_arctica.AAC.1